MRLAATQRKVGNAIREALAQARTDDTHSRLGRITNFERLHDEWRALNGMTKLVRDGKGNVWEPVRVTVPVTVKPKQ